MAGYVFDIRRLFEKELKFFADTFGEYSYFDIKEFDRIFINNDQFDKPELQITKINVLFQIWNIIIYNLKAGYTEQISDFRFFK
jgi:hypothetical protein